VESSSAEHISELAGQRLGPYQLVDLLGRGGMAVVYKALQPALRRYVAVKVLMPQSAHAEHFRARFEQEAETVAHLDHPNILPVYDYGEDREILYIVMPLVTGGTLREWLGSSVPLDRALEIVSRLLNALEYAHNQHVIHRDLKPTNVLMSQDDWPLLADFGLAKIAESTANLTAVGTAVGTPEYMSPEQIQGEEVDHRADLYAMGIILYKMLTGRVPFQGQTPLAVMVQHIKEAVPPPRSVNASLSPIWDDVIRRALAKNPRDRYPSAKAMDESIQSAWRDVARSSGEWRTVGMNDPAMLADCAMRALAEANWPRVIHLCGEILRVDPTHPEAVHLLTQAHEALRRQRVVQNEPTLAEPTPQAAADAPLPAAAPPSGPPPATLTVKQGLEPGRVYELDGRAVHLGRATDNDIQLQDGEVSRRHCQIRWEDNSYVVEDLGSSNGTAVNGADVKLARLGSGDQLQLGDQVLEFLVGADLADLHSGDSEHSTAGNPWPNAPTHQAHG